MWQKDYERKKTAYEKYYYCKLIDEFSDNDIAGYCPRSGK